jgi:hypothetical protein
LSEGAIRRLQQPPESVNPLGKQFPALLLECSGW